MRLWNLLGKVLSSKILEHMIWVRKTHNSLAASDSFVQSLEASETAEEVFSDAQEGHGFHSDPTSPIPTTRVEKVFF